ncbi:MAG: hypothetical protein NDI90_19050 [Nitrospira sp. BO4]|jgi:hypothetical protein|nr:hypothetical protein [Nitrospira sp. BO4]
MRMVWWWMPCARAGLQGASRLLLGFTLLQLWNAAPLRAEWSLVDRNDKAKIYVDSESIIRNGELVRVWVMDDLKTAQMRGLRKYLSSRAQEEHDCIKERFRLLALEYFSGNMGSGEALYKTSGESDWTPIPRGTLAQSVWKHVCKRLR